MREPSSQAEIFGLVAEFDSAERLVEGVREVRRVGFTRIDAYSPFPVEGLGEAIGFRDLRVPWLTLAGGMLGAAVGYGMQVYTNHAFAIDIGNRPLVAPPAFLLITFELTVLFAVLFAIGGMLALNHLPRLHHPVFEVDGFQLASSNKFFLAILSNDPQFDRERAGALLQSLAPSKVSLALRTEAPE
jgi:hypothetical protein